MANEITLADWTKSIDPGGRVDKVAEIMHQQNQILDDMVMIEGNLPDGHKSTIRTGLPTATWRRLYQGVANSKSSKVQVTDNCGMLEAYSEIDKKLADLNGNTAEFRLSEDLAFIEAMNQEMAETLLYGDTSSDPEKFLGLLPRYNQLTGSDSHTNKDYTEQVIDAGGTGTGLSSVVLVGWGKRTICGVFPKGSKAGLDHEDLGQVTLQDDDGNNFEGYRAHYIWELGLVVTDWRYVVRIANVDPTAAFDEDNLYKAYNTIPNLGMCERPVIYCSKDVKTQMDIRLNDKANVCYTSKERFGKPCTHFHEIPIVKLDVFAEEDAIT